MDLSKTIARSILSVELTLRILGVAGAYEAATTTSSYLSLGHVPIESWEHPIANN